MTLLTSGKHLTGTRNFSFRISMIYIVLGILWILFSDRLMFIFFEDTHSLNLVSTYKGWFYVLLTGWLLYLLVRKEMRKRNAIEAQLREAMMKAEESEKLKAAFLNNISHEIRTPLNAILGFSELIVNPELTTEQKESFSGYIKRGTTDLVDTIEDILIVSRIQVGQVQLETSKENVNSVVQSIIDYHHAQLKNQKNRKDLHMSFVSGLNDGDALIQTDFRHLKQILNKLIGNAIKFTDSGKVEVRLTRKPGGELLFEVSDTGCGIPLSKKDVVFNPFRQVDENSLNRKTGGSGLGLSIAKGLVELMSGQLWFESEEGKGSRFYFTLKEA